MATIDHSSLFIFIILCVLEISPLEARIAVIAHPDVASDSISSAELRDIYTGDFVDGFANGEMSVTKANGQESTELWKDGEQVK